MALFFDLNKLEKVTKSMPQSLYTTLKQFYYKRSLCKYNLFGNSFLLEPGALFTDKHTDILYKVQYIKLAGKRNYLEYKLYKLKTLDLSLYPDINIDNIKHNPLLSIKNNNLYFLYEE